MSKNSQRLNPAKLEDVIERLDPDVRFLLANERTLLAWVRTALTLIAGGVALTHFTDAASRSTIFTGIMVICLGGTMAIIGFVRYRIADAAIRSGKLPDTGYGPMLQVLAVILFSVVLVVLEVTQR